MLISAKTLRGFNLRCRDGQFGTVKEFYFDDQFWTVRYLVADTGSWLPGRQVLISPYALGAVEMEQQRVTVDLTKKQIEASPSLDADKPVSRQYENDYYGYYGWSPYWSGPAMWGAYPVIMRDQAQWKEPSRNQKTWNPHLRSTRDVSGYHIQASDGEIGHVDGFVIDDVTWTIRYLIVDTKNWWPGKEVLISPQWIERVSWGESKVFIDLSRALIKKSPEYTGESMLNRDYESGLHRHYKHEGYWVEELASHERRR